MNYKNLLYDAIIVYSVSALCSLLIIPLKKKPETTKRRKILKQRIVSKRNAFNRREILHQATVPKHSVFAAALTNIGKRIKAHLPPRLQEYIQTCSEAAMEQVQANLSCPNCGKQVVSAKKRILRGFFLSGTCPYCETAYRGGLIAPIISGVVGMSVYLDLGMFVETIPFLPQIFCYIISLFVVLPLCLFVPFILIGALALLISPLREIE